MRRIPQRLSICLLLGCSGPAGLAQAPPAKPVAERRSVQEPRLRPRPGDAEALFRMFARTTGLEASFEEEKHLALLALPLKSKGHLFFFRRDLRSPGYLARFVDEPEASSVLITPDELRLVNRDGTEVIDLKRSDKVRTFITSLVHVFAGEQKALAKSYEIAFALEPEDEARWTLTLTPRDKPLDQMLKTLRLVGTGEAVERIEIEEPNGDRTVTRIVTADPARTFDPAELKRLFGIDAR
ncbi:MAG TPA: outer membrane lipoprotein carrier protein LolA [Planctomycetota bacterium]|nr:outer membrane lipoprotein carrier protein LolA [Planctomycetota bacterium]